MPMSVPIKKRKGCAAAGPISLHVNAAQGVLQELNKDTKQLLSSRIVCNWVKDWLKFKHSPQNRVDWSHKYSIERIINLGTYEYGKSNARYRAKS